MTRSFRVIFLLLLFFFNCSTPETSKKQASDQLTSFINEFASVNPDTEGLVKEMSAASFNEELKKTKDQLRLLRNIDPALLSGDDLIDWKFAQSILVGRKLQQERIKPWKKNPRLYMSFTT